jgi:hypothetical protein
MLRRFEIINKIKRKRKTFFLDKSEIFLSKKNIECEKTESII